MKWPVYLFVVLLCWMDASAQQDSLFRQVNVVQSDLHLSGKLKGKVESAFKKARSYPDFLSIRNDIVSDLAAEGFIALTLDTFRIRHDTLFLDFFTGNRYRYQSIRIDGLPDKFMRESGLAKLVEKEAEFTPYDFESRIASILDAYQDQGYPFARFDSLQMQFIRKSEGETHVDIAYQFETGPQVMIDSVNFVGKKREADRFIMNMIDIQPGDYYSQEKLDAVPRMLNNSIYFKNVKQPKVVFREDKAVVTIELQQRESGKFDVLLGVLPPRENETKVQFTGLADLQLVSPLFRTGEVLQLKYEKLPGASQRLNLRYMQPYLFRLPLRAEGEFNLLKQDTLFITRYFKVSGGYLLNQNLTIRAFYKNKSSSLLSTKQYQNDSVTVPNVLDASDYLYGLGFVYENLDYLYNPTKGFYISADFGLGRKKIRENPKIHENIYGQLNLSQPKKEVDFEAAFYRRTFNRQVLVLRNRTFWLQQEEYFENDLLQVGGSRSIRGFNENQFFTSFYSFFTLEYRYLLERNSYLFAFFDYAYLENEVNAPHVSYPTGFGLGMTWETRAGMVSISYAVGKVGDIPFQPARGRIHIGLINTF